MKCPLLLTQVHNEAFGSIVSQYDYTYDAEGRRTSIACSGTAMSETRTDDYAYNPRGELVSATKRSANEVLGASSRPDVDGPSSDPEYAYQYDDIGNRLTSVEPARSFTYTANNLNQYTTITPQTHGTPQTPQPHSTPQIPLYDLDGNQTLIRTSTGDWQVTYNGENRPVLWTRLSPESNNPTNSSTRTLLRMSYDFMGRRVELIETEEPLAGDAPVVTNLHQKFVYDNYLCIQRLSGADDSITDTFEWDPTEPVATRPLFWQCREQGNRNFFYTHDGNKNVSEVISYQSATGVAAHYEYAPFGETLVASTLAANVPTDLATRNPWRFSSEYAEKIIGLVGYHYRMYNPYTGVWSKRDVAGDYYSLNEIAFCQGDPMGSFDCLGLSRMITFARQKLQNPPPDDAGQYGAARALMRFIDDLNGRTSASGCPCFDIEIKDLVKTPLTDVQEDIAANPNSVYVIAHGGLMVNGKSWGEEMYYWNRGDEVVEFVDYKHDGGNDVYTMKDLEGLPDVNVFACYLTPGHRKVKPPWHRFWEKPVSSTSHQAENLAMLHDRLKDLARQGCKETQHIVIYEGERTGINTWYGTERAMKDPLREEDR